MPFSRAILYVIFFSAINTSISAQVNDCDSIYKMTIWEDDRFTNVAEDVGLLHCTTALVSPSSA